MIEAGIYRHFKGGIYEVMCTAVHSESMEELVIYRSVTDNYKIWARPIAMWNETVEHDGQTVKRFTYLAKTTAELDKRNMTNK